MKPKIEYIGKRITYHILRNSILDLKLTKDDTILLNSIDFDNIVIEYLELYNESMTFPHLLLGVLIKENVNFKIPENRIGIIKNDEHSIREINTQDNFDDIDIAFRCGYCGGIVDENGNEIFDLKRDRIIQYLQNYENPVVRNRHGSCCKNLKS